jgi:predicted transglutaminase-like cysteine proteinase
MLTAACTSMPSPNTPHEPSFYDSSVQADSGATYKDASAFQRWENVLKKSQKETSKSPAAQWVKILDEIKDLNLHNKIHMVNQMVNKFPYVPSVQNWNDITYWESPNEFFSHGGQCMDYSVTKYMLLRAAGVSPDVMKIYVVRDVIDNVDHAVLAVNVDGEDEILDNRTPQILSTTEIKRYKSYYAVNEKGWWMASKNPKAISGMASKP